MWIFFRKRKGYIWLNDVNGFLEEVSIFPGMDPVWSEPREILSPHLRLIGIIFS
jgi:hypothetical protein